MTIGDTVKATRGYLFTGDEPIPVYNVAVDEHNSYVVNSEGVCTPTFVGGVKTGTTGVIDGHPVKAMRAMLKGYEKVTGFGSTDTVMLFPVRWEAYQQVAWVSADHFLIQSGITQSTPQE